CFLLASGLQINILKSQLYGVGVPRDDVERPASSIGCSIMDNQFRYLGVKIGGNMSRHKAWEEVVLKLRSRLSKWKVRTLSIGGSHGLLFRTGMRGSLTSGFFRRLSAYWKAFFVSLGGPYGSCGTALYLMLLLLPARRSLAI
nr:RNA-directed DNA polymerase, eukaryota, reverse transcriptase zinc-binding domain protein [Tanacetum cinerariifolium]